MTMTVDEYARLHRSQEGPAWRAKTATALAMEVVVTTEQPFDETTNNYTKYLCLKNKPGRGAERAAVAFPSAAAAERLNEDQQKTDPLKLMVLADMAHDEMQARTGLDVEVLKTWELLYFDVRGQRQATDWIARQVIELEGKSGDPLFVAKLKLAAIGGPVAVRMMLDLHNGVALDEADRLMQKKLTLLAKLDFAAEMPLKTGKDCLRYTRIYTDLTIAEKRIALAEQKLAQRCVEAHDRYELTKLRLEQAAERATNMQHEKRRQAEAREHKKSLRMKAEEERRQMDHQAMQQAIERRAAESPLAQFAWASVAGATAVPQADETDRGRASVGNITVKVKSVDELDIDSHAGWDEQDAAKLHGHTAAAV